MHVQCTLASPFVVHVFTSRTLYAVNFTTSSVQACAAFCGPSSGTGVSEQIPTVYLLVILERARMLSLPLPPGSSNVASSGNITPQPHDDPILVSVNGDTQGQQVYVLSPKITPAYRILCERTLAADDDICVASQVLQQLCTTPWKRVVVLGAEGWEAVDAFMEPGSDTNSHPVVHPAVRFMPWTRPEAAVRVVLPLSAETVLASAMQHPGLNTGIVITGDLSGNIRVFRCASIVSSILRSQQPSVCSTRNAGFTTDVLSNLVQEVFHAEVSHDGAVAVFVGVLGGAVAFIADESVTSHPAGVKIALKRFHFPTDRRSLRTDRLSVVREPGEVSSEPGRLRLANFSSGYHAVFRLARGFKGKKRSSSEHLPRPKTSETSSTEVSLEIVSFRESAGHALTQVRISSERRGEAIRQLLQGIDEVSQARAAALENARHLEEALASLNAALGFTLAWKNSLSGEYRDASCALSCDLNGVGPAITPAVAHVVPGHQPWAGARITIQVGLQNNSDVKLGSGWTIQLRMQSTSPDTPVTVCALDGADEVYATPRTAGDSSRIPVVDGSEGLPATKSAPSTDGRDKKDASIVYTCSRQVGQLAQRSSRDYFFSFTAMSHRPLDVSVTLVFYRENILTSMAVAITPQDERLTGKTGFSPSNLTQDTPRKRICQHSTKAHDLSTEPKALLRIHLTSKRLDCLHFATVLDSGDKAVANDLPSDARWSAALLPTARMASFFDPSTLECRKEPRTRSGTLSLPLSQAEVANALEMPVCKPLSHRILQRYRTSLGAPVSLEVSQGPLGDGCVVLARAPPHVLPFLRATVLRRVRDVVVRTEWRCVKGALRHRRDVERAVLDAADAMQGRIRELEIQLDVVRGWICETLSEAKLEALADGEDEDAMRECLATLNGAYTEWRSQAASFMSYTG